jgi:hypothetical protein
VKQEILDKLLAFEASMRRLRADIKALEVDRVNRQIIREQADDLATEWVEDLRSPLEHKFSLDPAVIEDMSAQMKRLHVLSRPGNRKTSYVETLSAALKDFKNRYVLPIQQTSFESDTKFDLANLVKGLEDVDETEYLTEAIACANSGYRRAAIVMGWCAAIDRAQRKIQLLGFQAFNDAAANIRAQSTGKYKRWNKAFTVASLSDLQEIFDTDLIVVLEGMGLIEGNQAQRLRTDFEYRNNSAHPGRAPIEDPHLVAFFTDICAIILLSPEFDLSLTSND